MSRGEAGGVPERRAVAGHDDAHRRCRADARERHEQVHGLRVPGGSGHQHAARQRVGFLPRSRAGAFDCQHSPQCSDASTVSCEGLTRYHRRQCPESRLPVGAPTSYSERREDDGG